MADKEFDNLRDAAKVFNDIPHGDWIDDDTFDRIWEEVCEWYDKNIDVLVKNVLAIYEVTDQECGYSALTKDWAKWREVREQQNSPNKSKFTADDVRKNIVEKINRPFCQLRMKSKVGNPTGFSEGFTGLMVTFQLSVDKGDEHDHFDHTWSWNLSVNVGSGGNNWDAKF